MTMEKWEYLTEFVWANREGAGVQEYLKSRWPNFKPDKYSPETMILQLNKMGEAGWELVSMQPVVVGNNSDIGFPGGGMDRWSPIYFCAFKRRLPG